MENSNKNSILGLDNNPAETINVSATPMKTEVSENKAPKLEAPELLRIPTSVEAVQAPSIMESKPISPEISPVIAPTLTTNFNANAAKNSSNVVVDTNAQTKINPPKAPSLQENPNKLNGAALTEKNNQLSKLQNQVEKATDKKISMKTIEMLEPAFKQIESSLKFTASMNKKRDFDDPHYTVPTTQSLFNLTANQITGTPHWRK